METAAPEKPWYFSAIVSFLTHDCPRLLRVPPSAFSRDLNTLERRLAAEGEGFVTKTLPSLGKVLDLALQGRCAFTHRGFRSYAGQPAFLSAISTRIFRNGVLLDSPDPLAIRLLRQMCFWFKKLERGFCDESLQRACEDFKEVDAALPDPSKDLVSDLLGVARAIIESVFGNFRGHLSMVPKHGPGAVEGGETVVGKRRLSVSYKLLENVFRPIPFFFSLRDAAESPERVYGREHREVGTSRMAVVEKDSSGPRVIGLEPAEYMWCQQAVKTAMYTYIENHPRTKGQVNFTCQAINRCLTADWLNCDTLDMSKASDRNSLALVRTLFGRTALWPYLSASRTPATKLLDGTILEYRKFAPMGSAVCFPVQAMVYFALACASLHLRLGYPINLVTEKVFVYGDDLVVPHGTFDVLNKDFESVGLKFNLDKSCFSGKFRESCGMDAYDGYDVTPVRARKLDPAKKGDLSLIPIVEHANSLAKRGYWFTAETLRQTALTVSERLRRLRLGIFSNVDLPILYWYSPFAEAYRPKYRDYVPHVKGWVFHPSKVVADCSDEEKYMRESLSTHGPVGDRPPGTGCRTFTLRYRGALRKKSVPYWPETRGCIGDCNRY